MTEIEDKTTANRFVSYPMKEVHDSINKHESNKKARIEIQKFINMVLEHNLMNFDNSDNIFSGSVNYIIDKNIKNIKMVHFFKIRTTDGKNEDFVPCLFLSENDNILFPLHLHALLYIMRNDYDAFKYGLLNSGTEIYEVIKDTEFPKRVYSIDLPDLSLYSNSSLVKYIIKKNSKNENIIKIWEAKINNFISNNSTGLNTDADWLNNDDPVKLTERQITHLKKDIYSFSNTGVDCYAISVINALKALGILELKTFSRYFSSGTERKQDIYQGLKHTIETKSIVPIVDVFYKYKRPGQSRRFQEAKDFYSLITEIFSVNLKRILEYKMIQNGTKEEKPTEYPFDLVFIGQSEVGLLKSEEINIYNLLKISISDEEPYIRFKISCPKILRVEIYGGLPLNVFEIYTQNGGKQILSKYDLGGHQIGEELYYLRSMVVNLNNGHYVSICRENTHSFWCYINDGNISYSDSNNLNLNANGMLNQNNDRHTVEFLFFVREDYFVENFLLKADLPITWKKDIKN
jgi:hypothetical protein